MFSHKKPIRIIERHQRRQRSVKGVPIAKTQRQIERELEQTVASWIDERRETVREIGQSNRARSLLGTRRV